VMGGSTSSETRSLVSGERDCVVFSTAKTVADLVVAGAPITFHVPSSAPAVVFSSAVMAWTNSPYSAAL